MKNTGGTILLEISASGRKEVWVLVLTLQLITSMTSDALFKQFLSLSFINSPVAGGGAN
jgi:hypothetical protein